MTRKKAYVIGTKVSKSLSPAIFSYWFEKHKITADYDYIEIKEKNFDKEIKTILKEKNLCGLNITIPFKEKIIPHIQEIDLHTTNIKAVNFVTKKYFQDKEIWQGLNTDWQGFKKSITQKQTNKKLAIVIGFGGAAKAIIYSLILEGFKEIYVFNRGYEKRSLSLWVNNMKSALKLPPIKAHTLEELEKHTHKASLMINTTPINILDNNKIWAINPQTIAFDAVYIPKEGTGFLKNFEPNKRVAGIDMLIYQAAPCFENWFGVKPKIDKGLYDHIYKKMEKK